LTKEQTHNWVGWRCCIGGCRGHYEEVREELRAGKPIDIEYRVRALTWVEMDAAARTQVLNLRVDCSLVWQCRGIEDRKRMEEALRKNRA